MATQPLARVSEEEYLRLERAAEYKSEYLGGEIFAMAGGSPRHARLASKWGGQFEIKLGSGPCKAYSSDLKIRTPSTGSYVYPTSR